MPFRSSSLLPSHVFDQLTDLRVQHPEIILAEYAARHRRKQLAPSGKLVILAADHPGRHVLQIGADALALGDRRNYLERILRVLSLPAVDGLMGTPDILDDVVLLNYLIRSAGGPDLLTDRVLVGCLNRGGLSGSAWELDDFWTGHTPGRLAQLRCDAAKMLLRLSLSERESAPTIGYCARWLTELNALGMPSFLEALPVARENGRWQVTRNADALIRTIGVATALGDMSMYTWLKLPYVPGFAQVARSTTLPILILGGESHGNLAVLLNEVADAMAAGSNVRGALIGRNVLWPGDEDPLVAAAAVAAVVHGAEPTRALREAHAQVQAAYQLERFLQ